MNGANGSFDSLWVYRSSNQRMIPRNWHKHYELLANKRQKPSGGWEPPLPLILAAWHVTTPIKKQLRFKEHIQWAHDNGQIDTVADYLRSLSEEDWYHFGEL